MADITAQMVKELRDTTGLGMMECKKALTETGGDMKAAEDQLRIKSGAKASKAAGRIAAEGMVGAYITPDSKNGALVEVNCETDFVARNEDFINFIRGLAQLVAAENPVDTEALAVAALPNGGNVDESRKALIMKLGENINVRRFVRYGTQGRLASYLHGAKMGVIVDYTGGDETLGKDLAMHIAASKPVCVSAEQISPDLLARERVIYSAQAAESGKSADIVAKMVEGRIAKYLAEVTLLGQPFVKDPDQTVGKLLASKSA
ncbi:MAG: translation elongation factor Ts, partial [Nitrosospira sp.]